MEDGRTAAVLACWTASEGILKLLIAAGADLNIQDKVTNCLCEDGLALIIDRARKCFKDGMTASMFAGHKGHEEVLQLLIDGGANLNLQDKVTINKSITLCELILAL